MKRHGRGPLTRQHPPLPTTPSPRLTRSRSGTENNSSTLKTSQRFSNRSKSTTIRNDYNNINHIHISTQKKQPSDQESTGSSDGSLRTSQRGGSQRNCGSSKSSSKSASASPSAWALSPGRSWSSWISPQPLPPERLGVGGGKKGKVRSGGVSGVFNYFRQKKAGPVQEEDYRRLRVSHNRLLQWRFANARAEASMASVKIAAEDRIYHVRLRIITVRSSILEKRIQIQKYKNEIKFCQIIYSQMKLLREWPKLEGRNCEAVSRTTRKLSALSVKLPLVEDAEGDVESILEAMSVAMRAMDSIEATIKMFFSKMEKILHLVTELASTVEHQNESLEEMEHIRTSVAELVDWERSLRAHLMQQLVELAI